MPKSSRRRLNPIGLLLLLALSLATHWASAGTPYNIPRMPFGPKINRCAEAITGSQWPPADWDEYLASRQSTAAFAPSKGILDSTPANPPLADARYYLMHEHPLAGTSPQIDSVYMSQVIAAKVGYHYLYTVQTAKGPFRVFQALQGGPLFSTAEKPDLSTLASMDQIVRRNQRNPDLDFYFGLVAKGAVRNGFGPRYGPRYAGERGVVHDGRLRLMVPVARISENAYRFAVRQTEQRGNLLITTIDTVVQDKPEGREISEEFMQQGRDFQREQLHDILRVLYPDYTERRGWSQDFINHDYQKVMSTADLTRYVIVQHMSESWMNAPIVAIMGLNRAPYGTTTYYNSQKNIWERRVGAFGVPYAEDQPHTGLSTSYVPLLGMENYLGILLLRPSVIDDIAWPDGAQRSYPLYNGSGVIYEPVKFFVARKEDMRTVAYTALRATILDAVFPKTRSLEYELNAQYLYTFNPPKEGRRLYVRQGFRELTQYPQTNKDGMEISVFGASPTDFLANSHTASNEPPTQTQEIEAEEFIRDLQRSAEMLP